MFANDFVRQLQAAILHSRMTGDVFKSLCFAGVDAERWSSVSRMLNLGLSKPVLAAAAGLTASSFMSQAGVEAAALFRPGYQSLASLASTGEIAKGAASDLLREYDQPHDAAPVFQSVLDAIPVLDDEAALPDERLSLLHAFVGLIRTAGGWAKSEVEKAGLIATLGIVISILGL